MNSSNPTICVVIPYYQIAPDPLSRAIRSILAQQGVERPMVLIVDDSSPLPAGPIIAEHFPDHEAYIRIIAQKNGGAAKARNTGLDNVPVSASYIAFLDSDDEWTPDHLANALKAFDAGCDFYFAGYSRTEWEKDRFSQMGLSVEHHKSIDSDRKLFEYVGDALLHIMGNQMVKTSTVVYRRNALADIRFPENLVLGEDDVFWVKAMRRAHKSGFCKNIGVKMGKGVNISQGGKWGDVRSILLMTQNMQKWKLIPKLLPDEPKLEPLRIEHIHQLRQTLAATIWYRLRRGMGLPMRHIMNFTSADPAWLFSLWTPIFMRIKGRHHE